MDDRRFDALTRALTGATSRRRLFMSMAGSALGALAVALGVAEAGATHYRCLHVGRPCKRNGQCCSGRCQGRRDRKTCRAHDVGSCTAAKDWCTNSTARCGDGACFCYRTTGGANFCGLQSQGQCMACTTDAQCVTALDTLGAACVDLSHGNCTDCGGFATACVPPCPV